MYERFEKSRNKCKFALPGVFCLLCASKWQIHAIWRVLCLPVTACTRRETRLESLIWTSSDFKAILVQEIASPGFQTLHERRRYIFPLSCTNQAKVPCRQPSAWRSNRVERCSFWSCPMLDYNSGCSRKTVMLFAPF